MARTVAIFLGVWVAISIPTGIVIGRLLATASRLHAPDRGWKPSGGAAEPRVAGTPLSRLG
jgi:hypothetical protein